MSGVRLWTVPDFWSSLKQDFVMLRVTLDKKRKMQERKIVNSHVSGASQSKLIANAREIAPRLARRAPVAEAERRPSAETMRDLHQAGLLAMVIPLDQGGTEADLATQLEVYQVIGGACASTAWVLGNHLVLCTRLLGMLGAAAKPYIDDVTQNGMVVAHAAVPGGTTKAVDGGFVMEGRWPFVSGVNVAGSILLSTMVPGPAPGWQPPAGGAGKGVADPPASHNRWMLVSPDDPGLRIEETWRAMSLRASTSNDVVLNEIFVPEDLAPVNDQPPPHRSWLPDGPPALRVPLRARVWMSAMMLEIAQAAMDDTIEYATDHKMSIGGQARTACRGTSLPWPTPPWRSSPPGRFFTKRCEQSWPKRRRERNSSLWMLPGWRWPAWWLGKTP